VKAKDIMTKPVITIEPDTTVPEIATLLFERRISGVPVVEAGRLVGLVSEADLLHRHELGTDHGRPARSWWARLIGRESGPAEYVKSHARRARDVMTRNVISVAEDTPIAKIATVLERHRIKRVPVLRSERLVGIVSRANLVEALAARPRAGKAPRAKGDDSIRRQLLAELERQPWWRSSASTVIVTEGIVHYWGLVDSEDQKEASRIAAENVPGVRRVEDHRMRITDLPSMV
jgi:CBS domain-containing protein